MLKAAAVLHLLGRTGISCNLKLDLRRGETLWGTMRYMGRQAGAEITPMVSPTPLGQTIRLHFIVNIGYGWL